MVRVALLAVLCCTLSATGYPTTATSLPHFLHPLADAPVHRQLVEVDEKGQLHAPSLAEASKPSDLFTYTGTHTSPSENFVASMARKLRDSVVKIETVSVAELPVKSKAQMAATLFRAMEAEKARGRHVSPADMSHEQLFSFIRTSSHTQVGGHRVVKIPLRAVGSGFIADVDTKSKTALVITNSHVVTGVTLKPSNDPRFGENANRLGVMLGNGERYNGTVLGKHEYTDVAVIRLDNYVSKVEAIPMAPSSSTVESGEWVTIMGAPLAFEQSVTEGVVSRPRRFLMGGGMSYDCTPLIQTDCAINEGNSGGPAISRSGEVMGIVTSKIPNAENLGFVVPADSIRKVVAAVMQKRPFPRPHLGLSVRPANERIPLRRVLTARGEIMVPSSSELLRAAQDPVDLEVTSVVEGGPSDRAGVRKGDSIVAINGHTVTHMDDYMHAVCDTTPGVQAKLSIARPGQGTTPEVNGSQPQSGGVRVSIAQSAKSQQLDLLVLPGLDVDVNRQEELNRKKQDQLAHRRFLQDHLKQLEVDMSRTRQELHTAAAKATSAKPMQSHAVGSTQ